MIDTARAPVDEQALTSIGYELGADEAHVWTASLDQPADMIANLAPLLSRDEYQRAMRYHGSGANLVIMDNHWHDPTLFREARTLQRPPFQPSSYHSGRAMV